MALLALICAVLPAFDGSARAQTATDPLAITIDSMTPSASGGDIQLTGTITNNDVQTWRSINILPCVASNPILSATDLATATASPYNSVVCSRVLSVSTAITQLDAGVTATWSLTVPSSVLPQEGGVYWFGVHALATDAEGQRLNAAEGRARTFLPLVGSSTQKARLHLVVEFTEPIEFDADGHLNETTTLAAGAPTWTSEFEVHLSRLLTVVNSTPGADMLVDPALIDAAMKLADGNPGWLGTAKTLSDTKAAAQAWLSSFKYVARTHQVWALPYGDVDINATADRPDIARSAAADSVAMAPFRALGVRAAPARRSPDLRMSGAVVSGPAESIAFADARVVGSRASSGSVQVVGTALASLGAPKPGDPYAEVPLRQQILAEAALHVDGTAPVVVVIPSAFSPSEPAAFAKGLAVPWIALDTLPQALNGLTPTPLPDQPKAAAESAPVHQSVVAYDASRYSAAQLRTLTGVDVTGVIARSSLTALTRAMVHGPVGSDVSFNVGTLVSHSVAITAPPGVTLSGSSGHFLVSVENKLPVPITVGLRTAADQQTSIGRFPNLSIPAHEFRSTLVNVSINAHGNHRVLFEVVDTAGHPTGVAVPVTVRSVQVSNVIWGFIAAGVGLLGFTIVMRLIRRIRSRA